MRRWAFEDAERLILLPEVLGEWMGTPFRRGSRAKGQGGGVDCVHFVQEVYWELNCIWEKHPMPRYSVDWHQHRDHSLLMEYLETYHADDFEEVSTDPDTLMIGDLLLFNPGGRCVNHAGILHKEDAFVHAVRPRNGAAGGVIETPVVGSGYGFRLEKVWRPREKYSTNTTL